jgi:hypothetical protein
MLVELDVDSSGEVGDVIDEARCCVGVPFGLTKPMGLLMGVPSGVLGLMTGDIWADVVLADFWWPTFRSTEVILLRLARRGMDPCGFADGIGFS